MVTPAFGSQRPQELEDIFGPDVARRAEFGNFLTNRFPGVAAPFRNFLNNQRPVQNLAFGVNDVNQADPTNTFARFLEQQPSIATGVNYGVNDLNNTADFLRGGPFATGLSDTQRAAIEILGRNPTMQFQAALAPQILPIAQRFRPGFANLAAQGFDTIMAEQGTDPNFQFLPFLQERNFRLW